MKLGQNVVAKGVKYLLKKQGYTLIKEYPTQCTNCLKQITGFDVKKGDEEPLEIDLCPECLQKALNISKEDVKTQSEALIK